jgi:hypothetical protein
LASITGQNFLDLGSAWGDPAIGGALSNANGTDRGPLGSCVFQVAGESGNRCLDNLTQDQASDVFSGRWDQFRGCDLRQDERVRAESPVEMPPAPPPLPEAPAAPAAPAPRPAKKKRPPAKTAKKKPVKKRAARRAAKRAPAAARTKSKKKTATKAKRRPAKATAKRKPTRTAKKAKRR